jgi:hypothetical protein
VNPESQMRILALALAFVAIDTFTSVTPQARSTLENL